MRISIWQQFASNHSASYTVVGEFESTDEAKAASEKIRYIIDEIVAWCHANPDECRSSDEPTPIEQRYAEKYGFDWKEKLDGIYYGTAHLKINQIDRLVVIDDGHLPTWQTGHQYANLLRAMHGKVARGVMEGQEPGIEGEIWESMNINVNTDTSPDIADSLVKELQLLVEQRGQRQETYSLPWLVYHPDLQTFTHDEIRILEAQYLADQAQAWPLHDQYRDEKSSVKFHEAWSKVRVLPHDQWILISHCRMDVGVFHLTANQTLQGIEVRNISFSSIPIGFLAFVEYLRNNGCTNIQYSIQQDK